jgi:hypothetical protein
VTTTRVRSITAKITLLLNALGFMMVEISSVEYYLKKSIAAENRASQVRLPLHHPFYVDKIGFVDSLGADAEAHQVETC